jgi:hypothetical protein
VQTTLLLCSSEARLLVGRVVHLTVVNNRRRFDEIITVVEQEPHEFDVLTRVRFALGRFRVSFP